MGQPVVHFEIIGKDGEKLQRFYADLFDWKIDANNPMKYGMVDTGGGGINGGVGSSDQQPHGVTIYAQVDDPDAYLAKAEQLGGKIIMPTTEIPDSVTFALFADPEGHLIGLVKG